MSGPSVGVSIQAFSAAEMVDQIAQAEAAGISTAWSTIGGAGGADPLVAFAAALTATRSITLGTAIIPTWPRHPIALAHQALALEQLAPGRFRLGIGPSHEVSMAPGYGVRWEAPLQNLREYLQVLRALLYEGSVDFDGRHVVAHTRLRAPAPLPLMASALRPKSYETCGELSDGAISWMSPLPYLLKEALPAIRRGAERAGRTPPPLIAHVPVIVSTDRERAHALAQQQLSNYARIPFYQQMFEQAGFHSVADGYPPELLDTLVVHGDEDDIASRLAGYISDGVGEVLAAPVIDADDREGSIERAFRAIARADALVRA